MHENIEKRGIIMHKNPKALSVISAKTLLEMEVLVDDGDDDFRHGVIPEKPSFAPPDDDISVTIPPQNQSSPSL